MTDKKETHLDNFYQSLNRLNKIIDELELEQDTIRKCFEMALDEEVKRREKNIRSNIMLKNGARGTIVLDEAKNEYL